MLPTMTWGQGLRQFKIVDMDLRPGDDATTQPQPQQILGLQTVCRNPLIGHFTLDEGFREVVISICLRVLSQARDPLQGENPLGGARYRAGWSTASAPKRSV